MKTIDYFLKKVFLQFESWLPRRLVLALKILYRSGFRFLSRGSILTMPHYFDEQRFSDETSFFELGWVLPGLSESGGGYSNIFRFVGYLDRAGVSQHIIVLPMSSTTRGKEINNIKAALEYYNCGHLEFTCNLESPPVCARLVATGWQTANYVRSFRCEKLPLYLVQDYEPMFFSEGFTSEFIRQHYVDGFQFIVAGDWIASKLKKEHQVESTVFRFSYEPKEYCLTNANSNDRDNVRKVFFYARPVTPRRYYELGLQALSIYKKRFPEVEIVFAGWEICSSDIPFDCVVMGDLNPSKLRELYNECDLAIVFSGTNLSLLPIELMACGAVVLSNKGPQVEWQLSSEFTYFVEPTPNSVYDGLAALTINSNLRKGFRSRALRFVQSTNWEDACETVYGIVSGGEGP